MLSYVEHEKSFIILGPCVIEFMKQAEENRYNMKL